MKRKLLTLVFIVSGLMPAIAQNVSDLKTEKDMDRIELCKKNYTTLFGGEALTGQGTDPEMMDILQKFIFGEVFRTGELDIKTREMITCVTLATMQTLPQLKAHAGAALNVGVTPVELPCHWKNKARLRKKTVMKKGRLCKTGFIPAVSAR